MTHKRIQTSLPSCHGSRMNFRTRLLGDYPLFCPEVFEGTTILVVLYCIDNTIFTILYYRYSIFVAKIPP